MIVNIPVKVKNVHLNIPGKAVDRGTGADIAHAIMNFVPYPYPYGKYAARRNQLITFGYDDIGRRIPDLPADLVAADNRAGNKKWVAQKIVSLFDIIV